MWKVEEVKRVSESKGSSFQIVDAVNLKASAFRSSRGCLHRGEVEFVCVRVIIIKRYGTHRFLAFGALHFSQHSCLSAFYTVHQKGFFLVSFVRPSFLMDKPSSNAILRAD